MLSPLEFYALEAVQQAGARRWAESQALQINMRLKEGAIPFTADDFLGKGDRIKRQSEHDEGQMRAALLNSQLGQMRPGVIPDQVPDWAR